MTAAWVPVDAYANASRVVESATVAITAPTSTSWSDFIDAMTAVAPTDTPFTAVYERILVAVAARTRVLDAAGIRRLVEVFLRLVSRGAVVSSRVPFFNGTTAFARLHHAYPRDLMLAKWAFAAAVSNRTEPLVRRTAAGTPSITGAEFADMLRATRTLTVEEMIPLVRQFRELPLSNEWFNQQAPAVAPSRLASTALSPDGVYTHRAPRPLDIKGTRVSEAAGPLADDLWFAHREAVRAAEDLPRKRVTFTDDAQMMAAALAASAEEHRLFADEQQRKIQANYAASSSSSVAAAPIPDIFDYLDDD